MNRATLQPTKFVNHPDGSETYGYRIYDDYDQTYDDCMDSCYSDNMDLLRHVIDQGDQITCSIIDFVLANKSGIYLGDTWYEWSEIEHLFTNI